MELYNVNDGITGRDGGPYLDRVEQERAEIARAKVEGREPNLDNPGGCAGTVYVTGEQLINTESINNTPSQNNYSAAALNEAAANLVANSKTLQVAFVAPDLDEKVEAVVEPEHPVNENQTSPVSEDQTVTPVEDVKTPIFYPLV